MLATTSQQITATTEEIASTADQLSHDLANLESKGEKVTTHLAKMDNIIKDVAGNSNLLGLNAASEAARAGD
jgi:methyl-accepting chemotaxis protein